MDSKTLGNILYIGRALANYRTQLNTSEPLRPQEALLISYVHRHSGCTQNQLVKYTGFDKTTVAHRLNELEERGFLRREISKEDGRKRVCYPTEKAESFYPAIHEQYQKFKRNVLGTFTEEELALLEHLTARMKLNAEGMILSAEPKLTEEPKPEGRV